MTLKTKTYKILGFYYDFKNNHRLMAGILLGFLIGLIIDLIRTRNEFGYLSAILISTICLEIVIFSYIFENIKLEKIQIYCKWLILLLSILNLLLISIWVMNHVNLSVKEDLPLFNRKMLIKIPFTLFFIVIYPVVIAFSDKIKSFYLRLILFFQPLILIALSFYSTLNY